MHRGGKTLKAADAIPAHLVSIIGPMDFYVLVVGDRVNQTEHVLLCFLVEAVEQDRVGGPVIGGQFQFGIVHSHVAIVSNAEFSPDLQNNLHPFAIAGHRFASRYGFTDIAYYSMDAAREQKGPIAASGEG
jgi:hypothetical protein